MACILHPIDEELRIFHLTASCGVSGRYVGFPKISGFPKDKGDFTFIPGTCAFAEKKQG